VDRAKAFKEEVFSIPVHPYLTDEEVDFIIETLKAVEVPV
jgi:dTDP-4-amino-4,6-dideoxygalactose transaminase